MSVINNLLPGSRRGPAGRLRRTAPLAVALLAGGALLAACSSATGGTAGSAQAPASGVTTSAGGTSAAPGTLPLQGADGMHLPIEQYFVTASQLYELNAADQLLVSRCMASYGFQFTYPAQPPVTGVDTDPANMARRYGVSDPQIVAQYGYHIAPAPVPPSINMVTSISEAEYDVFWGHTKASNTSTVTTTAGGTAIPAGGCTGKARQEMTPAGIIPENGPIAEQIDDQSFATSQTDPQVVAATSKWSACMARSGYTVATPLDAMAKFTGPLPASAAEITEAKTDLACKTQTKLISIWVGVETKIQDQLIAKNQLALTQSLHDQALSLARAASIAG